jgi:hypothetical protein
MFYKEKYTMKPAAKLHGVVNKAAGNGLRLVIAVVFTLALGAFVNQGFAKPSPDAKHKIFAQALVEATAAKHPELESVGMGTTPPGGEDCVSIADTDAKEVGDKCDAGELAVMKSGKATVEKEADVYDVTVPFRLGGKTIGIIGMDFHRDQPEAGILDKAEAIAKEVEDQVPEKSKLFEAAK